MASANNWNQRIIEEFRSNGGKVGGSFANAPLLLLTSTGAKSGRRHTTPVRYFTNDALGDSRFIVIASKGGQPTNPDWYYNLLAHPEATVEVGTETFDVVAKDSTGDERDRLFAAVADEAPAFGDYQTRTTRVIPVIVLERTRGR